MRDPYTVLGVSRQADEAAVKKAFRKLAKQYHPDRNTDDVKAKDKFAEINSAYEIVGDSTKRGKFDRGEIDADGKPRFQGMEGFPGGREGFDGFSFGFGNGQPPGGRGAADDIFSNIFTDGLRGGRSRARRGEDLQAVLHLTVEDIAGDAKQRVTLPGQREIEVTIPPGAQEGQTIRLRGLGNPGHGGAEAGDLLLTLKIAPHERYTVEGSDLRMRLAVPLDDAVLGGKVRVATPTGDVEMNIAPMTSSGRTFRLRGRGLPARTAKGDLLVTVEIMLPDSPDDALTAYAKTKREAKVG